VANWVGSCRKRKSTQPGTSGLVELSPFEFLDRLAELVPPQRKHRHRYQGVFAPDHELRRTVTALAIGNVGKRGNTATGRLTVSETASGIAAAQLPHPSDRPHRAAAADRGGAR